MLFRRGQIIKGDAPAAQGIRGYGGCPAPFFATSKSEKLGGEVSIRAADPLVFSQVSVKTFSLIYISSHIRLLMRNVFRIAIEIFSG